VKPDSLTTAAFAMAMAGQGGTEKRRTIGHRSTRITTEKPRLKSIWRFPSAIQPSELLFCPAKGKPHQSQALSLRLLATLGFQAEGPESHQPGLTRRRPPVAGYGEASRIDRKYLLPSRMKGRRVLSAYSECRKRRFFPIPVFIAACATS
jgi:hypothetical protein